VVVSLPGLTMRTYRDKQEKANHGMEKGFVHVYTGNGKGKTTAAIGLSIRALGAGLKVLFIQFLKKGGFNEISFLRTQPGIEVRQFGTGKFVRGRPSREDIKGAENGLKEAKALVQSGRYDVVVLDEANMAVELGLIEVEDLLNFLEERPKGVEVIITGRSAHQRLIEAADLVTEMREIKHYYKMGVRAREGIER